MGKPHSGSKKRASCVRTGEPAFPLFGAFGYQALGASGGAAAMLVYYAFGTLAYAYLWGQFGVLKPSFRVPKLSLGPALAVLRIGGMSAVVSASTNLTLAIVTAYMGMGGVEALAGYGAGSRLEFLWCHLPTASAVQSES
jgi:Na+-driven multidrug efflux pump